MKEALKDISGTSLLFFLRLASHAVFLFVLSRLLSPTDAGMFVLVNALAGTVGLVSGLGSQYVFLDRTKKFEHITISDLWLGAFRATFVAGFLSAVLFTSLFYFGVFSEIKVSLVFMVGVTEIVLVPLTSLVASAYLADGMVAKSQIFTVGYALVRASATLAMYLLGIAVDLSYIIIVQFFVAILLLSLSLLIAHRRFRFSWFTTAYTYHDLIFGFKASLSSFFSAAYQESDKLFFSRLNSSFELGLYSMASRVYAVFLTPVYALVLTGYPLLYSSKIEQKRIEVKALARFLFSSIFLGGILGLALYAVSEAVILFFDSQYSSLEGYLPYFSVLLIVSSARISLSSFMMVYELPVLKMTMEGFSMVFVFVLSKVLFAEVGTVSVVIAIILSECLLCIMFFFSLLCLSKKSRGVCDPLEI